MYNYAQDFWMCRECGAYSEVFLLNSNKIFSMLLFESFLKFFY